jgi:hypothetical protein
MTESDPTGLPEDTSRSLDDLRKEFEFCLDALYWLGRGACDEIRDFEPDLLLVLAHGGWGALWATQVCWQATQEATLPLVLATNLGREKIKRYYGIRDGLPCVSISPFVADYAQEPEVGYFLDWVSRQIDWQEQLRSQVLEALDGRTPRRILVLDDTTWEGGTYRLALALLEAALPTVEVHFLASVRLDWRGPAYELWLKEHAITLPAESGEEQPLHRAVYHLVPGTEDVDAEGSLAWQSITAESALLQPLADYYPLAGWLELPVWVESAVREGMQDRLRRGIGMKNGRGLSRPSISPSEILARQVWRDGRINRRRASRLLAMEARQAGDLLSSLVERGYLQMLGRGRGAYYTFAPEYTLPEDQRPPFTLLDAWWVQPGRLLAGDDPFGGSEEGTRERVDWLLEQGITCTLDLTDGDLSCPPDEYVPILHERAAQLGRLVTTLRSPISTWKRVCAAQIRAVRTALQVLEAALAENLVVYVHGGWDNVSMLVGCYLVERGMSGLQALDAIARLRRETRDPWRRLPAWRSNRRLVSTWARRRG